MNFIQLTYIKNLFIISPFILLFLVGVEKNLVLPESQIVSNFLPEPIIGTAILYSVVYLIYYSIVNLLKTKLLKELKALLIIVILLSPFILNGPFFLPPSDPIFHGNVLWDSLYLNYLKYTPNREYISKIFFGIIYKLIDPSSWTSKLNTLYVLHIFLSIHLIICSYVSSRLFYLNRKWAFVSVLIMFLFFGTNRFSYFTYYSIAPSSFNMGMYWLITSILFNICFRKNIDKWFILRRFVFVFLLQILILPILFFQHRQEVGLLFFSISLILFILGYRLFRTLQLAWLNPYLLSSILFFVLFIPHLTPLKYIFSFLTLSILKEYHLFTYNIANLFIIGNISGPRILDTLSFYGFVPLFIFIAYSVISLFRLRIIQRYRIIFIASFPGLVPFWILFIPINLLIWSKAITAPEVFWRLCYSSQYWIAIACILQTIEFNYKAEKKWNIMKNITKYRFFTLSIVAIICISNLSRPPIYGKLKFISLNTFFPYYEIAKELDSKYPYISISTSIQSDPVSKYSFFASYGMIVDNLWRVPNVFINYSDSLNYFFSVLSRSHTACLINLKGFPDTWVPYLTGHWDPIISNTARFYEHNGYTGKKLAITIENQFKDKCIVLKDKELLWEKGENFRYHSPNLNYTEQQEDIHILQFKKDSSNTKYNILIDAGFKPHTKEKLLDYLAIHEIYQIDEIYITHPHKDHYSGLYELINFGIPIKKVWMNLPLKENCDREIPWGCDYPDLLKLMGLMKEKGIEHKEVFHTNPQEPLVVYKDARNTLSILFASPPINPQPGNVDINDLSILMKLDSNGVTYLFTGDLNNSLSEYLKENPAFQADILKIPHHGTEGVASNNFFDRVGAKIGIVPSPQHLWCSERSSRIRNYFKQKKSKMYVSGFYGDILIRHFENGKYKVTTQLEPEEICGDKLPYSIFRKFFNMH